MDSVKVEVLFFAKAREVLSQSSGEIVLTEATVGLKPAQIVVQLEAAYPALKSLQRAFVLALNEEYLEPESEETFVLRSTDQLAVIPPISGG